MNRLFIFIGLLLDSASTSGAVQSFEGFHPENFLSSTEYMGKGMLAIFITIAIIVIATSILNKIKDKSDKQE